MSTNGRKGNRTSIPARGGARRSNTPPPPSLGPDGSAPPDSDPISTSRPRNEGEIPVLNRPPADVVAAVAAAAEPEPTAKSPPVAAPPPAEPIPPPRAPVPTLLSAADGLAPRVVTPAIDDDAPFSQPPPSARSVTGSGPVSRRRGRNSNLPGTGRTSAPPATTSRPPPANLPSVPAAAPAAAAPAAPVIVEAAPVAPEPVAATSAPPAELPKAKPASIPPPSDSPASAVPASDLDRSFFERGDSQPHGAAVDDGDLENDDDPRMKHKNSPEARARRERNWMYVLGAAAGCVVLMGVAMMRNGSRRVEEPVAQNDDAPVVVTVVPSSAPAKVEIPPVRSAAAAPSASASPAPSASGAIPVASTDDLPSASPSGSAKPGETAPPGAVAKVGEPGAAAGAPPAAMAEPTEAEKKSAVQDKRACQSFLDQGAFAKAVEAGERAVALDPTDGDSWLMLGAAYQSMGKSAEARRSFSSCVAEGKRGQINECRSMLR